MPKPTKMTKRRPDRLSKVLICEDVLTPLEEHLRTTGLAHREEAALLTGYILGKCVGLVTTVLLPYTESSSVGCILPMDVTVECMDRMNQYGQIVLAQVHTHPGRAWHSDTDDHWAFTDSAGLFSIVIPAFGRFGLRRIFGNGIAIYEREKSGDWSLLSPSEKRSRFFVIPTSQCIA